MGTPSIMHPEELAQGVIETECNEEVSKFEHLARELVNAFRIHDFSHEKVEALDGIIKDFLKKINKLSKNSDDMIALLSTSYHLKNLTAGLRP